jgi:hypothetical protein
MYFDQGYCNKYYTMKCVMGERVLSIVPSLQMKQSHQMGDCFSRRGAGSQ